LGDLEFEGIAVTDGLKDDGYALSIAGADISRFKGGKAPLLLQHDPNRIVGTSSLRKTAHSLILRGKFASPGVSSVADEARRLLKDGVLNSISMGFAVGESERLGKSPRDGVRVTKWEALECSLVAVGLDSEAVVTQRALSRMLLRSGRRLSAETQQRLRTALEHHRTAMRCQRDGVSLIEDLLDRDDGDDGERSRVRLRLQIMRRRWSPAELDQLVQIAAIQRLRERKHGESPERVQAKLKRLRATAPA
jgi:hypothetical protein